ncbi:DDB1- and CUL4-associated factor 5-like [Homalodisca vitripennis]|uniref:DDB1- and CUL4-associated factor 5-like n=1 Tax=Homalodisca vitripennis TaxID=197043 RepID=UPI001EEB4A86|nr:DDB1- and CUL4-associated factor 5-like [Homalodisca vitripennis]
MYKPRSKSISNTVGYLFNREYSDSPNALKQNILSVRLNKAKSLYSKNLLAHFGCVNAIEFSNGGEFLASGGDDRRVLLWNVEEALDGASRPTAMRAQHISNIFCLVYDSKNTKIFSAGNDDQVIIHDTITGDPVDYFLHEQPVYCLSIDPFNDNVFASACEDGRILIYDIREPTSSDPFALAVCSSAFHGVMFNPCESQLVATANAKDGAALWDVRKPKEVLVRYGSAESCMSVRWDGRGHRLLALRRRMPPILYPVDSPFHLAQFDHSSYYNSCTMKSCSFAGENDQYVLSGSDDFNLYMWKIPESGPGTWVPSAHMILTGHRSIVNQVRFNSTNHLIASSGVEKMIKVWSPFPLPNSNGDDTHHRRVFSHEEYIGLVLSSGQFISHDYSHESTKEDPRMMAFFDSLVQREIEGWTSGPDSHSEPPSPLASDHVICDDSSSCSGSENEEKNHKGKEGSKDTVKNRIVELIARKRAQLIRIAQNSRAKENNTSDSSDSGTAVSNHRKHACKRKRRRCVSTSSESDNKSSVKSTHSTSNEKRKKLLDWEDDNSSDATDRDTSSTTTLKDPSNSSETPDSGIALRDRPTSSKFKSRPHRNYRRHLPDSDSD